MKWDKEHLQHYLKTSVKFTQRYKAGLEPGDRSLNLVTVLARISAVQRAANSPHVNSKASMGVYTPLSSKQRYAIKRVKYWIGKGRKVNLYAESPEVLALLHRELAKLGIDSVLFTGKQDIKKRAKALHEEFRYGYCQVLLSSYVGQCGLNLEQASLL